MKKYYTIFITEESNYHCERIVATYEAKESLKSKEVFDLFLKEQIEKNACWSVADGNIPGKGISYEVEGITVSDTPVDFISSDELYYDPSNRLGLEEVTK